MKHYYDNRHCLKFFKVGQKVLLKLYKGYSLPVSKLKTLSRKLQQQYTRPFTITERIERLAYRLNFPNTFRIHNVVSIAHLEPIPNPLDDLYKRTIDLLELITIDKEKENEIKKLISKCTMYKGYRISV